MGFSTHLGHFIQKSAWYFCAVYTIEERSKGRASDSFQKELHDGTSGRGQTGRLGAVVGFIGNIPTIPT